MELLLAGYDLQAAAAQGVQHIGSTATQAGALALQLDGAFVQQCGRGFVLQS